MISLFGVLFDYIVKVIKPLYSVSKVGNYWFATYYTHNKDKLEIIESTYNLCLFYNSKSFSIVRIQTDNTLILADNIFASIKEDIIRSAKIMTKNKEHFSFIYPLKFNGI